MPSNGGVACLANIASIEGIVFICYFPFLLQKSFEGTPIC